MNRILSTAIAAAIAVTALGASVPAMSAPLAPAAVQPADTLLMPVHHKKWHGKGKKGHGKGFGIHLNFGVPFGYALPAWCYQKRKRWIPGVGLRVRYVNVCH